jgi:hypothetical protein
MKLTSLETRRSARLTAIEAAVVMGSLFTLCTEAWPQSVFTPYELRHMTNDPETNPTLSDFADKIEPPLAEALKNVQLAGIVSSKCLGATLVRATLDAYVAQHITRASAADRADAAVIAHRKFQGLTYVDVASLCAGVDYLFGPKGAVVPNAVKAGTGKSKLDGAGPDNPYVVLP